MTKAVILSAIAICLGTNLSAQTSSADEDIERKPNWGFSADFFLGYGTFTGDLREKYKGYVPLGVGLDLSYRKIALHGTITGGFSRTKVDIPYDTSIWKKKSWYEVITSGLSLGYVISEDAYHRLEPFGGLSFMYIGPSDNDDNLKDVVFDKATFYTLGFNLDIAGDAMKNDQSTLWFLRLRYTFNFQLAGISHDTTLGNMHTLTLGVGFLTKRFK